MTRILTIESSCDETAAVIKAGRQVIQEQI